jgi:HD-GYP domain-containing protein (c-di-GMP phosphodiesterase class II)
MRLKPLTVTDIRVGEPLPWPVYDRAGHLLLKQGVVVASENQQRGLIERGFLQDRDDSVREHARPTAELRDGEDTVFGQIRLLAARLRAIHQALRAGGSSDLHDRIVQLVGGIQAALRTDADAALAALQIDAAENGFIERHLHAAALCELIGRALDQPAPQRLALACAALTFDIGFAQLHCVLDRQAGPLDSGQRLQLHEHPQQSVALLRAAGIEESLWLSAVLGHHERIDGSGYPRGLRGDEIGHGARLLAICDSYSAMIRPRAYREALHARIALRDIFLERGKQIDEAMAAVFIKELGIYPPGTFVRLQNGEIAVVTRRQRNAAQPALRCVVNRDGTPVARAAPRDCQTTDGAIVEVVSSKHFRCVLGMIHSLWEGREELRSTLPV